MTPMQQPRIEAVGPAAAAAAGAIFMTLRQDNIIATQRLGDVLIRPTLT
jgi:hypothetical protein